jgi:hypothetical protein
MPIVMAPVDDPYEFVASLARPSGNITGLALQQTEIDAKQVEILKETVPSLSRLVIFYSYGETYYALESVAHALGIEAVWIETKGIGDVHCCRSRASFRSRKRSSLAIAGHRACPHLHFDRAGAPVGAVRRDGGNRADDGCAPGTNAGDPASHAR